MAASPSFIYSVFRGVFGVGHNGGSDPRRTDAHVYEIVRIRITEKAAGVM